MLSTQSNINQQATSATTTGGSGTLLVGSASPSPTTVANIKGEPFCALSPLNDTANVPIISDVTSSSSGNLAMDSCTKRDRECPTASKVGTTSAMRQKSNNSINSSPNTFNASSPNNSSEHSNSNTVSPNLAQPIDSSATDIIADLNNSEKNTNQQKSCVNALTTVKEESGVKATLERIGNLHASSTKNFSCSNAATNILSSAKDEADNITISKKEEGNISPDMSPAGFGSIPNLCATSLVEGRSRTPVVLDEMSKPKAANAIPNCSKGNLNNDEKATSVLGTINNFGSRNCGLDSISVSEQTPLVNTSTDSLTMGGAHPSAITLFNNNGNCGGSTGNGMEYMQQQNHIFVFSTQLANKGAESVLSGQFPTIITYHCTQPATKTFLEDFFIKNPLKMSKLQRQSSGTLCNTPGNLNGQQWIGSCNRLPQITHKSNGNKTSFTGANLNLENKASIRQPNMGSFSEMSESLGSNESDLMCWEQTRHNVDGVVNEGDTGKKLSNRTDGPTAGSHIVRSSLSNTIGVGNDSGTPSLQGIKVPDENLTPQQRQHREEQLAKLKQIDQFLSNPLQGGSQLSKLVTDGTPGNISSLMLNLSNSGPSGLGNPINNSINSNLRNLSNTMSSNHQNICNRENITTGMMEETTRQSETLHGNDIEIAACRSNEGIQLNNKSTMSCVPISVVDSAVSNGVGNDIDTGRESDDIVSSNSIMPNSPEMLTNFNADGNVRSVPPKAVGASSTQSHEMGQVGISQIEWCKLQHQLFEERIKVKSQASNETVCIPMSLPRSNSTAIVRCNTSICSSLPSPNTAPVIRTSQGPPPPYHPTQRSASVPIATQSSNPPSPNNPTSHRSLPSPRTSTVSGRSENSPNVDAILPTSHAVTSASTMSAPMSNLSNQGKNSFQPEGSPTSCGGNNNSNNCSRNNHFNSNPSTPISHISPKDLDSFQANMATGDFKTSGPSPQRARTPLITSSDGNIMDTTNIEANFTTSSPGLSFTHQMSNTSNSISYKGPGPIEHPTAAPVQFCRRTDTIPFNPNSGRLPQKKPNLSFDPISSLAQMSQQLTSCVSINSNGLGNIGGSGMNDVNVPNSNNQIMEGIINSMDSGANHCTTSSSSIGVSQHLSGHGPFVSNNCHINAMLGSVGQRLLSPKVCAGLGHVTGNIGRDGSSGIHGVVQTHRFVGRMGMNFGNFNVSSNIQVKASTPNTIQYMPMHPQNNNSDMRVPPSLEFLRYANAQISGTGNVVENSRICHGNAVSPSDPGKVNNSNNGQGGGGNTGIDFFGNCPQIDSLVGDHDELVGSNLVSGRNMNTVTHPSMTRTIRPVRHQQMGHPVNPMIPGARMQAAVGPMLTGPFPNEQQETMECGDSSLFIGSHSNGNVPQQGSAQMISGASNPGHIYSGANNLQKSIKPGSQSNICQNLNIQSVNNPQISTNIPSNEQISSMQSGINSAIMIANTGSMLSNAMQVGNNVSPSGCGGRSRNSPAEMGSVGYKPFVGPVSSDVKYAQQYHSFQQQLYATATRSQNSGNNSIIRNVSTNPTFFPNK